MSSRSAPSSCSRTSRRRARSGSRSPARPSSSEGSAEASPSRGARTELGSRSLSADRYFRDLLSAGVVEPHEAYEQARDFLLLSPTGRPHGGNISALAASSTVNWSQNLDRPIAFAVSSAQASQHQVPVDDGTLTGSDTDDMDPSAQIYQHHFAACSKELPLAPGLTELEQVAGLV